MAGILAREKESDLEDLAKHGYKLIRLVMVGNFLGKFSVFGQCCAAKFCKHILIGCCSVL